MCQSTRLCVRCDAVLPATEIRCRYCAEDDATEAESRRFTPRQMLTPPSVAVEFADDGSAELVPTPGCDSGDAAEAAFDELPDSYQDCQARGDPEEDDPLHGPEPEGLHRSDFGL
jgi:hypothetical protein